MSARIKGIILFLAIIVATLSICVSVMAKPNTKPQNFESTKTQYFLGEFEGKLAIYKTDISAPLEVLDVQISSLPERDITRINNKIYADTLSEIITLAEDYE